MAPPTGVPTNILPATSGGSPQFYIDFTNGVDTAGQSGAIGAPWKTLTYAVNTRLVSGGTNDRKGLGAFINLRTNHYHSTSADTVPALLNLGGSVAVTQNTGGSVTDPWTIRTAPEDLSGSVTMVGGQPRVTNPAQGSGRQAVISARTYLNTGFSYCRWERIKWDSARMNTTQFDTVSGQGGQYHQLFYCENTGNRNQILLACDSRASPQQSDNCGAWGCLIHDGGIDAGPGAPHDHGIYCGTGTPPGANDCWAINCVIYKITGFAVQWYEKAGRMLVANCTMDECSYPTGVEFAGDFIVAGADATNYSFDSVLVNSILSTVPNQNGYNTVQLSSPSRPSAGNPNLVNHNCYFPNSAVTNENTDVANGYPNAVTYGDSNVTNNPLYANRAGRDYRPLTNSPVAAVGNQSFTPATDFNGNPFLAADLGAFAVTGGSSLGQYVTHRGGRGAGW